MFRLTVIALLLCAVPMARAASLDLSAGHVRAVFTQGRHLQLFYNGVPVIRESHLYLVKPGWSGTILNQDQEIPRFETSTEGVTKVGTVAYENDAAWAKYRIEVRPDDTVKVSVTWAGKVAPAEVEYTCGYVNANIIQGVPYSAQTIEGPKSGAVPMYATSEDQNSSQLCPRVTQISFDSLIGRIEVEVTGSDTDTEALKLFDARGGQQDWARQNPIFWFGVGVPQIPVKKDQGVPTLWRFSNPVANVTVPDAKVKTKVSESKAALMPYRAELPVIPRPKEMKDGPGKSRIDANSRIYLMTREFPEAEQGAKELQAELKDVWGVSVPIISSAAEIPQPPGTVITISAPGMFVVEKFSTPGLEVPEKPEAYSLGSRANQVFVNGWDPRGIYYGIQTLKQLIRVDKDGVYIKEATIRDWPSMSFRGVHWFGGPNSYPFHEAMISRICAATKMNKMLFQVDYSEWKTQPDIWDKGRATSLADIRKTVNTAREHFMEPIPLVNGLGHADWMFVNGKNLDVATDSEKRYQYDPAKSRVYTDILFPVMQEAIDIFQPKVFHIGRDEITTGGVFPPKGAAKSVSDLITDDINKVHAWLKTKGIRTMMWGDEFLRYPDETNDAGNAPDVPTARARRSALPKDIIIADWHYTAQNPDYPSVGLWQKEGFEVVGCPWFERGNVRNFSRVLATEKSLGLCQTTWAGWSMSTNLVAGSSFKQFVAYLLAGEYAWNGGEPTLDTLGYDPDDAFRTFWERKPVEMESRAGFTVDFGVPSSESRVSSLVPELGTQNSELTLGGTAFRISSPVILAGSLNPAGKWPKAVTARLNDRKARELRFLWATTHMTQADTVVARVKVEYKDGTSAEKPVTYTGGIFAFEDLRGGAESLIAWRGKSANGRDAAARMWAWVNPSPEKPIASVTVTSEVTEAAPVLLGLTGIK